MTLDYVFKIILCNRAEDTLKEHGLHPEWCLGWHPKLELLLGHLVFILELHVWTKHLTHALAIYLQCVSENFQLCEMWLALPAYPLKVINVNYKTMEMKSKMK